MARKKTTHSVTYYRIVELSNGAVISQPYCNIENKFHLQTTENGKPIGILVQVLLDENNHRANKIVFVYKNQRNLTSPRLTRFYRSFVENCIDEAVEKNYIKLNVNFKEENV